MPESSYIAATLTIILHNMTTQDVCIKATEDLNYCSDFAFRELSPLSIVQLNLKPSSDSWSVGEVLSHLITSNSLYIQPLKDILSKKGEIALSKGPSTYKPTFIGNFLIRMLDPASTRKLKHPAAFSPLQSKLDTSVIGEFIANNNELIKLIERAKDMNTNYLRISSPAMALMRYSVADTFVIFGVHQRRHFGQIRRIIESPAFPR